MKDLLVAFVVFILILAGISFAATKPRVYSGKEPPTKTEFDNELRDLYNAINELPLDQYGEVWLPEGDSANVVFGRPFADTLYGIAFTMMRDWKDSTEVWTATARITVGRVWPESCHVWHSTSVTDKGWLKYVATGKRP